MEVTGLIGRNSTVNKKFELIKRDDFYNNENGTYIAADMTDLTQVHEYGRTCK